MIPIIVIAVFAILFCVLAVFAGKTWLWRHVTLLFGVFVMTMLLLVLAAVSLQTQKVWRGQFVNLQSQIDAADQRLTALRGPTQIDEQQLSLPQLQADLSRTLLHRGRVWRGATLANADQNTIKLDMSNWSNALCVRASVDEILEPQPVDGEAGAAKQSASPEIAENTLVHAFVNSPAAGLADETKSLLFGESDVLQQETRGVCGLPNVYVGHFIVAAVDGMTLTLQPVAALDEQQRVAMKGQADWTLYEVLPADDHAVFEGLSEEALTALFSGNENVRIEELKDVIREYVRDQTNSESQDPPERIHSKVKFLSDYSVHVDVDGDAATEENRSYDIRGRAIPIDLRQGHPTEFKAAETVEFDSATAKRLVEQGVAEFVDEPSRYVRQLRNYELIFRYAHDAVTDVQEAINLTDAEYTRLKNNIAQIQDRIAYHQKEKGMLQQDLAGFERDLAAAKLVRAELRRQREVQIQLLNQLYQSNQIREVVAPFQIRP